MRTCEDRMWVHVRKWEDFVSTYNVEILISFNLEFSYSFNLLKKCLVERLADFLLIGEEGK